MSKYLGPLCKRGHDHNATGKSLRYKNSTCVVCAKENASRRWREDPASVRAGHRLRRYGITNEAYDRMLVAQGGVCAICGTTDPGRGQTTFHIDHDHKTSRVRGLLCHGCNTALGGFADDVERLLAAVSYLKSRAQ